MPNEVEELPGGRIMDPSSATQQRVVGRIMEAPLPWRK
jgi:hypothetical protein